MDRRYPLYFLIPVQKICMSKKLAGELAKFSFLRHLFVVGRIAVDDARERHRLQSAPITSGRVLQAHLKSAPIGRYRRLPRCRWIVSVSGPSSSWLTSIWT